MNTADFINARQRIERKSDVNRVKLTTLSSAVRMIKDGNHIAIGGCLYSRTPLALLMEMLRQHRTGLTLSRNLMCYEGEWFIEMKAVDTIVTSWFGIGLPWGLSKVMRNAVENGRVSYEEWSHMALGLRYRAAAMGLSFLPSLTMLGSDLMKVGGAETMVCPFTGQTLSLIPALFPDVSVLHVHRADRFGNCQIDGYAHMDADIALAATTVLVTAEEIVDDEVIRQHPERTVIPGFVVDAVTEVPFGSFPHECYGLYEADITHFGTYVKECRDTLHGGLRGYLDKYLFGVKNHQGYLDLFGTERLQRHVHAAQQLLVDR